MDVSYISMMASTSVNKSNINMFYKHICCIKVADMMLAYYTAKSETYDKFHCMHWYIRDFVCYIASKSDVKQRNSLDRLGQYTAPNWEINWKMEVSSALKWRVPIFSSMLPVECAVTCLLLPFGIGSNIHDSLTFPVLNTVAYRYRISIYIIET